MKEMNFRGWVWLKKKGRRKRVIKFSVGPRQNLMAKIKTDS